jgi:hypothetical protein
MTDKVIPLRGGKKTASKEEIRGVRLADEIDSSIARAVMSGMNLDFICLVVATRLGETIKSNYAAAAASDTKKFDDIEGYLDWVYEFVAKYAKGRKHENTPKE